jgi:hypothetical protein
MSSFAEFQQLDSESIFVEIQDVELELFPDLEDLKTKIILTAVFNRLTECQMITPGLAVCSTRMESVISIIF